MKRYLFFILFFSVSVTAVTMDSPPDNHYFNSNDFVLTCTGAGNISAYIDGNFLGVLDGGGEFSTSSDDGKYKWYCGDDNANLTERVFYVDTTFPVVDILNPEVNGQNASLKFDIKELNPDVCYYIINLGENKTVECFDNFTVVLNPGNNTFEMFVTDKSRLTGTDLVVIAVPEPDRFVIEDIYLEKDIDWTNFTFNFFITTNYPAMCRYGFEDSGFDFMQDFTYTNDTYHNLSLFYIESADINLFLKCKYDGEIISNETDADLDFTLYDFQSGFFKSWDDVGAGKTLQFDLSDDTESIQLVSADAARTLGRVRLRVSEMNDTSLDKPENEVYKYFQINWLNMDKVDFDNGIVVFKVNKDWLGNLSTHDVVLLRYDEGWEEVNTYFKRRYGPDYFFESQTDEFSVFAVSLKNELVRELQKEKIIEVKSSTNEFKVEKIEIPESTSGRFWIVFLIIFVLVSVFGGYIYFHKEDFGK